MIPYGKHNINAADIKSVTKVLKSDFITQGKQIEIFEKKIKKYLGVRFAVAVSSCSAGLHLAAKAINLKKGNVMLTSPITFCSTANAALHCGAKVEFADVDYETGNISIESIKKKLKKKRIKALFPVHFGGLPCKMKEIRKLSKKNNFYIIEDAAHALGSKYDDGTKVGSCKYSDMAVFSFHPVKSITTGEGGIITTNNKSLYEKLIKLRSHGIEKNSKKFLNSKAKKFPWYYEVQHLSNHYRLTDFQCVLGSSQLNRLDSFINKRRQIAAYYDRVFKNNKNLIPLQNFQRHYSSNHLYILRINFKKIKKSRTEIMNLLRKKGIITQVHYIPLILQKIYDYKFKKSNFKNTLNLYDSILSIPIYFDLKKKDQIKVINEINNAIEN